MNERTFDKRYSFAGHAIRLQKRSRHGYMGRFGGGWQWVVGVQWGGRTVIINLLVMSIRIDRKKRGR